MENEAGSIEERKQRLREELGIHPVPEDADPFLFRPGAPRHQYAVVKGHNTWDVIAEGYRLAAEKLADAVLSMGTGQDCLVYPICFMYRCYLEIRLKELLVSAQPGIHVIGYRHDLLKLWKDAEPLVRQYSGAPTGNIDRIEPVLRRFHEIDPAGDGFRYPFSAKGARNLRLLTEIDIGELNQTMSAIAGELDGASTGLYEAAITGQQE